LIVFFATVVMLCVWHVHCHFSSINLHRQVPLTSMLVIQYM